MQELLHLILWGEVGYICIFLIRGRGTKLIQTNIYMHRKRIVTFRVPPLPKSFKVLNIYIWHTLLGVWRVRRFVREYLEKLHVFTQIYKHLHLNFSRNISHLTFFKKLQLAGKKVRIECWILLLISPGVCVGVLMVQVCLQGGFRFRLACFCFHYWPFHFFQFLCFLCI